MSNVKTPIAWRYKTAFGWKIRDEKPPVEWCPEPVFSAETVSNLENQLADLLSALKWIDAFAFDAPELRERARLAIASVEGGTA